MKRSGIRENSCTDSPGFRYASSGLHNSLARGHSLLADAQGTNRAGGHTCTTACAAFIVDLCPALVNSGDGLVVTASKAGHADHIIPGDAGITVQDGHADPGVDRFSDLDFHGAGLDTGPAKGAAGISKIEVRDAGQFMVCRVHPDDVRLTGCHAWMCAARAVFFQCQALVPGWGRPQWLLPQCFCVAAFTGQ